jgi:hypothetical protein
MRSFTGRAHRLLFLALVLLLPATLYGQARGQAPAGRGQPNRPAQPRPQPAPAPAAPKPATAAAETAKPPAPPPPQDVRFRTTHVSGDKKTTSVTYLKGERERYEFQEMVLLNQHDTKQRTQINLAAKTYLVTPIEQPSATPAAAAAPAPAGGAQAGPTPGVITITTTIVDTGERKTMFGQQARRVKTLIDKKAAPKGCDPTNQKMETDGWYIDAPKSPTGADAGPAATTGATPCIDEVKATVSGDPKALGFPVAYTTTATGHDNAATVISMEVTEYEVANLEASLFEVPPGLKAVLNTRDFGKALREAEEAKLNAASEAAPAAAPAAPAGAMRIAVVEPANRTDQKLDTRTLRARMIASLTDKQIDAAPLTGKTEEELRKRAAARGFTHVLTSELTELKENKPSRFNPLANVGTEASLSLRLLQIDGKPRLVSTAKGNSGGNMLTRGTRIAWDSGAVMVVANRFLGPAMMARLNGMGLTDLGGMGLMGSPSFQQLQLNGVGRSNRNAGVDASASVGAFMFQRAMTMDQEGLVESGAQAAAYDQSIAEALEDAAGKVQEAMKRK